MRSAAARGAPKRVGKPLDGGGSPGTSSDRGESEPLLDPIDRGAALSQRGRRRRNQATIRAAPACHQFREVRRNLPNA